MHKQGRIDGDAPSPVSFRTESFQRGTSFPPKTQTWGELNYALSGVCEIEVLGVRYLSPPAYGIWIPPQTEHSAWNHEEMIYVTVYVHSDLCKDLPTVVQTIALSPLLKAILADFSERHITSPATPEDQRLAMVLVDQVRIAPRYDSYLPFTGDDLISPIILALQSKPDERRSLAEWARLAGVTERTLSRRWQQGTGLSFNEWRQRQKLVVALSMLEQGEKVQSVATSLGYSDPSAFIAMFRRQTGFSPTNLVRTI